VKEFLSLNHVEFVEKNIATDERAVSELEHLGYMTTPVILVDGDIVVGFDVPKLKALLTL